MTVDDLKELDAVFAEARRETPGISEDLAARILSDADALVPRPATATVSPEGGVWTQIRDALGGWVAVGGLTTACAAGLAIGLIAPAAFPDLALVLGLSGSGLDLIGGGDLILALTEDGI